MLSSFFESFTYHKFGSKTKIVLDSYVEGIELSPVLKSLGGTDLPHILLLAVSFWRQMMFKNIEVFSHEQNNECNLTIGVALFT